MIVREYRPADYRRFREMNFALQEFEHALEPASRTRWRDRGESYASAAVANHETGASRIFVVEADEEVFGFITCRIDVNANPILDESLHRQLTVQDIYLEPAFRGRGIGQGLLQAAMSYGRARGVSHATIGVLHKNPLAVSAYVNAGFELYEHKLLRRL
jgi:ribosomal protein S18 acetylase RimI-like enzyme